MYHLDNILGINKWNNSLLCVLLIILWYEEHWKDH
jgi:hypothetical protein